VSDRIPLTDQQLGDTIWLQQRPCGCIVACVVAMVPGEWSLATAEEAHQHLNPTRGDQARAAAAGLSTVAVSSLQYREQYRSDWRCDEHVSSAVSRPFTAEELAAARADVDALDAEFPDEPEPAAEESEACGKCRRPFDPADTRFDGHARFYLTAYCRRCVDLCHDNESADHRCVICA
jgi:hypothetical protein